MKDELILKQHYHFSSLPFRLSPWQVLYVFSSAFCCGQALTVALSRGPSPLSHSVFNICPAGLSQPLSAHCSFQDVAPSWRPAVTLRTSLIHGNSSALLFQNGTAIKHNTAFATTRQPPLREEESSRLVKCQTVPSGQI